MIGYLILLLILCAGIANAAGIGIVPSEIIFEGYEEKQLIIYNQNSYNIKFQAESELAEIICDDMTVPAYESSTIKIKPKKQGSGIVTFYFTNPASNGIGIETSLSLKIISDDESSIQSKGYSRNNAEITGMLNNNITKEKRNIGPALGFAIIAAGLAGYFKIRS